MQKDITIFQIVIQSNTSMSCGEVKVKRSRVVGAVLFLLFVQGALRISLIVYGDRLSRDGTSYLAISRIYEREPLRAMKDYPVHPGYPAMVAGLAHCLGMDSQTHPQQWLLIGRIISAAAAVSGLVAAWWLGWWMLRNMYLAYIGVMLWGLARKTVALGIDFLPDTTMLCFALWALVLAAKGWNSSKRYYFRAVGIGVAVGALAGAGFLVKPEGGVVVLLALLLWGTRLWGRRGDWPVTASACGSMLLTAAVIVGPYMLFLGKFTGKWQMGDFQPGSLTFRGGDGSILAAVYYPVEYPAMVRLIGRWIEAQQPVLAVFVLLYIVTAVISRFRASKVFPADPTIRSDGVILLILTWGIITVPICLRYLATGALSHRYLMLPAAMMCSLAAAGITTIAHWISLVIPRRQNLARFWIQAGIAGIVALLLILRTLRPLF
jgi:hypothetical protein